MKKTLILLLAAFMLLGFAACDTESTNDNSSAESVEASVDNSTESSAESEDSSEIKNKAEKIAFKAHCVDVISNITFNPKIINSTDELKAFKEKYYNGKIELDEKLKIYDSSYFEKDSLIVIHKSIFTDIIYEIESVGWYYEQEGKVVFADIIKGGSKHDKAAQQNWLFLVEVKKSDIEGYARVVSNGGPMAPITEGKLQLNATDIENLDKTYSNTEPFVKLESYGEYVEFIGQLIDEFPERYDEDFFEYYNIIVKAVPTTYPLGRLWSAEKKDGVITLEFKIGESKDDNTSTLILVPIRKLDSDGCDINVDVTYFDEEISYE